MIMPPAVDAAVRRLLVRSEIEQFYVEQMGVLDDGDAAGWAATFIADGVFVPPSGSPEVRGRAALEAGARQAVARLSAAGALRRHVLANLNLVGLTDQTATTTACVLVVDSTAGESRLTTATAMRDDLVLDDSCWRVARRVVRRDDLMASDPVSPGSR